jgi:hypothetical protein
MFAFLFPHVTTYFINYICSINTYFINYICSITFKIYVNLSIYSFEFFLLIQFHVGLLFV